MFCYRICSIFLRNFVTMGILNQGFLMNIVNALTKLYCILPFFTVSLYIAFWKKCPPSGVHVLIFECRLVLSRCAVVCGCSIFFPKNLVDEIWEMPFQASIFKSKPDYQITIAGFLDVGANQVMEWSMVHGLVKARARALPSYCFFRGMSKSEALCKKSVEVSAIFVILDLVAGFNIVKKWSVL